MSATAASSSATVKDLESDDFKNGNLPLNSRRRASKMTSSDSMSNINGAADSSGGGAALGARVSSLGIAEEPFCLQAATQCLPLYFMLGKIMGVALRTKVPLHLNLHAIVWKQLVSDKLV